ncbi:MAG: hypothetical protein GAK45_00130 [Pseudomonas citronellolis]|nr:MAG: hypothetical protein GAK45_00130 [Pseudomonas citronellolis]
MFYSQATGGFYSSDIHGAAIPADAVEITDAEHAALMAGQAAGLLIQADTNGRPVLAERTVTEADTRAAIATRRYQAETAGTPVGDNILPTDRDSQALITGAALSAMRNSDYVLNWKTTTGFIQLNAEQLLAMADAVRDHVQACFDREAELLAALADGSLTPAMIDEGWPA